MPNLFLRTSGYVDNQHPVISPDGHWIAYQAGQFGRNHEVHVQPYPAQASANWQVSAGGGRFPIWSRNSRELFYLSPDNRIMVVNYGTSGYSFVPGKPKRWSDTPIQNLSGNPEFDLAPDGKRFAIIPLSEGASKQSAPHVTLLVNIFDELRRRLPERAN
jgi:Tol biopolymer transport system component